LFIFTLIFELKTNKSYKIALFTIASHPNFRKNSQKPLFSVFLLFFIPVLSLSSSSIFIRRTAPAIRDFGDCCGGSRAVKYRYDTAADSKEAASVQLIGFFREVV